MQLPPVKRIPSRNELPAKFFFLGFISAHAKKQKSKAPREEDSFSDDEDDLFGNSLSSKQRLKVDRSTDKSQPGLAKGSNVTIDPQVQERLLEVERERVHRFNGTYEKLKSLTGKPKAYHEPLRVKEYTVRCRSETQKRKTRAEITPEPCRTNKDERGISPFDGHPPAMESVPR